MIFHYANSETDGSATNYATYLHQGVQHILLLRLTLESFDLAGTDPGFLESGFISKKVCACVCGVGFALLTFFSFFLNIQ